MPTKWREDTAGGTETILDLVDEVRAGSTDAFEPIVRRFELRIRAFCRRMLGNEAAGDDAAQEVFLRAYQRLDQFRGERGEGDQAFERWLVVIARHHCIDELRRHRDRGRVDTSSLGPSGLDGIADPSPNSLGTRDVVHAELLGKLLQELPDKHREILLLRELYGYGYDDIARILSLSMDGVKGQLKRARSRAEQIVKKLTGQVSIDTAATVSQHGTQQDSATDERKI